VVLCALLALSVPAAADITLKVDNAPGANCSDVGGDPFCTISAAVAAASAGDKIKVDSGTYAGFFTIPAGKTGLRLIANSEPTRPVIDGGVIITANGVIFKGFEVNGIGGLSAILLQNVTGVSIIDNDAHSGNKGILLSVSTGNLIKGNRAHDNVIGFDMGSATDNNTFKDNEADHNAFGFAVGGSFQFFDDNDSHDNTSQGFVVFGDGHLFKGNKAEMNATDGFRVLGTATGNRFEDNEANNNGGIGFDDVSGGINIYQGCSTLFTLGDN
jgi:parallel beta-helix repeat protein